MLYQSVTCKTFTQCIIILPEVEWGIIQGNLDTKTVLNHYRVFIKNFCKRPEDYLSGQFLSKMPTTPFEAARKWIEKTLH